MRSAARFQSRTRPSTATAKAPSPALARACSSVWSPRAGGGTGRPRGLSLERGASITVPPVWNASAVIPAQVACLGKRARDSLFFKEMQERERRGSGELRGGPAPVGRGSLSRTEPRAPGPARPCASLELVLEGDPEDLGGVVLPVLAEEDGAAAVRRESRSEGTGLLVGIDEALVRVEELGRPILRERVVERRV